jgi:hypothetical protein
VGVLLGFAAALAPAFGTAVREVAVTIVIVCAGVDAVDVIRMAAFAAAAAVVVAV